MNMGLFGNSRLDTARYNLQQYEKTRPADYQSKYNDKIMDLKNQMTGMGDFDYDPDADAAYQQYKNEYTNAAKLANKNAQASASAMTGGYGSSYGTQAGQNAYASTMSNLDSVLNALQNQSLAEYNTKKNGLSDQLSALQAAEKQDYSQYQNDLANWKNDLAYYQNEYDSAYNQDQQFGQNLLNGLLQAASIAAQVIPFFFI